MTTAESDELKDAWIKRVLGVSRASGKERSESPVDTATLFSRRIAALKPRIEAARGRPLAQDLKLKLSEAAVFARKQDYARAHALLDEVLVLVDGMPSPQNLVDDETEGASPPQMRDAPAREPPPQSSPRSSPRIVFTQSRILWDNTRKQVQAQLQQLEQAILAECADEPDYATIAGNSKILYTMLDFLDERLIDKLDDAMNAEAAEHRTALQDEAREIIDEYIDYIRSDELLHDIDDNGFVELKIIDTVTARLTEMDANLRALPRA